MSYGESEVKGRIRVIRNRVEPVLDGLTDTLVHFEVAKNDFHWLMEQVEKVESFEKEMEKLKEYNIGVALYETRLLHKKLEPDEYSSVDSHFKRIIEALEQ